MELIIKYLVNRELFRFTRKVSRQLTKVVIALLGLLVSGALITNDGDLSKSKVVDVAKGTIGHFSKVLPIKK